MIEATKSRSYLAVLMALVLTAVVAATAQAGSGGLASGGTDSAGKSGTAGRCAEARFGERKLRLGDCGQDVKTLHWILKSRAEGSGVRTRPMFIRRTASAVRRFQQNAGIKRSGVVNASTRKALVTRMGKSVATWYGPGFWGNRTACGQTLKKKTVGVAHKKLPCGTKVTIGYRGRFVRTRVIDRGPYAHGASWDLTQAAARKIRMQSTSTVRAAVIR